MATFTHEGAELWYSVHGDERDAGLDTLIVLHGGLGLDHTYFRPWLDPLSEGRRLVYLDLRANGRSTGDGQTLTIAQLADDVDALRRHLGAERIALLGHSYGGFVALQYALTQPEKLSCLVLCDTDSGSASPEIMARELIRLGADEEVMAAFDMPVDTIEQLQRLFEVVGPYYMPHSSASAAWEVLEATVFRKEAMDGGDRALADWDVGDRLGEIRTPTLVITGADDFLFPPERAERLGSEIPSASVVVMEDAGHLPFVEQQAAFLSAVSDHLQPGGAPARR
jgi:proline iminopeptidase